VATGVWFLTSALVTSCSTEQIGLPSVDPASIDPATQAPFMLSVADDADTFDEQQRLAASNHPAVYTLKVDGQWATVPQSGAEPWLVQISAGSVSPGAGAPWSTAGSHVFELVDGSGKTVLETPPYELQTGQSNHLVVFGHRDHLEHRFFADRLDIPAGMQRFTALNLIRTGQSLQVLQCDDPSLPESCATVAGPLAYGEMAQGDAALPASDSANPFPVFSNLYSRIVPTGDAPTPGLSHLGGDPISPSPVFEDGALAGRRLFVGAPTIVTPSGDIVVSLF
jgi:hypothetical protein